MSTVPSARRILRMLAGGAGGAGAMLITALGPAGPAAGAARSSGAVEAVGTVRVVAACPVAAYGVRSHAPGSGKTVALTFDDGPGKNTAQIIAVLRQYGVPATFFNLGENEVSRQAVVRSEASLGFQIGNHTWSHPYLTRLSASGQASQLDRATAEQIAITGTRPCVFRPPYGSYNSTTLLLAQQRHLRVWTWSVDPQDWMARGSASSYWVNRIISVTERQGGAQAHPVVLLHNQPNGNPATVRALPVIIQFFLQRGYRFVTL